MAGRDVKEIVVLHGSEIARIICKSEQRSYALYSQATSEQDHKESDIAANQDDMKRPHYGRRAEGHQDQTAQRHQPGADRACTSHPRKQANKNDRGRGGDFYQ